MKSVYRGVITDEMKKQSEKINTHFEAYAAKCNTKNNIPVFTKGYGVLHRVQVPYAPFFFFYFLHIRSPKVFFKWIADLVCRTYFLFG